MQAASRLVSAHRGKPRGVHAPPVLDAPISTGRFADHVDRMDYLRIKYIYSPWLATKQELGEAEGVREQVIVCNRAELEAEQTTSRDAWH